MAYLCGKDLEHFDMAQSGSLRTDPTQGQEQEIRAGD